MAVAKALDRAGPIQLDPQFSFSFLSLNTVSDQRDSILLLRSLFSLCMKIPFLIAVGRRDFCTFMCL